MLFRSVKRSEEEGKDGIAMGMRREEKRGEERGRKEERRGEERRGEERRGEKRGGTWIWQRQGKTVGDIMEFREAFVTSALHTHRISGLDKMED